MVRNRENEPDWQSIVKRYRKRSNARAMLMVLTAFGPFILLTICAYALRLLSYPLALVFCFLAGLSVIRIFSVQHDLGHDSFIRNQSLGDTLGFVCGIITLTPYKYWRKVHLMHHRHTANLSIRDNGDFPIMTVDEYREATPTQRFQYRVMRHPAFLLGVVPFLLFFVLQRIPFGAEGSFTKTELRSVHWTNLALFSSIYLLHLVVGWEAVLMIQLPISLCASTFGVFLFFAHHQYEETYWAEAPQRSFYITGIQGSAHLDFGSILNWFMGNTGYHHIHHLCPAIPSYRLPEAYGENPALHPRHRVTLGMALTTFQFALWDRDTEKLVRFADAEDAAT
ncbi:fatty acid desaturase [Bacteriovoracales bacterium]|nr:fatty acid desaturase [Bacteriovoracales bacterium]